VPFGNKATLLPGYRGLLNLVMRSGEVREVIRQIVRDGDTFEVDPFSGITHKFGKQRGEWSHAYACARYKDGSLSQPVVMTREEIESHRDKYSKGAKSKDSPWKTEPEKMALKTVIRQFVTGGYVTTSAEFVDLASREMIVNGEILNASPLQIESKSADSQLGNQLLDSVVAELAKIEDRDELFERIAVALERMSTVGEVDDFAKALETGMSDHEAIGDIMRQCDERALQLEQPEVE